MWQSEKNFTNESSICIQQMWMKNEFRAYQETMIEKSLSKFSTELMIKIGLALTHDIPLLTCNLSATFF